MKKLILSITLMAALVSVSKAQIGTTNSFILTLGSWVTSNPTNSIFSTNDTLELSSGILNNNNQNMEMYVDARVNPVGNFAVGGRFYNDSVLGTITGVGGYVGYGIVNNSIRITPEVEAGYDTSIKSGYVAPTLMAEKAMTSNTYTQIGINVKMLFHGTQNLVPGVFAGAGFTF